MYKIHYNCMYTDVKLKEYIKIMNNYKKYLMVGSILILGVVGTIGAVALNNSTPLKKVNSATVSSGQTKTKDIAPVNNTPSPAQITQTNPIPAPAQAPEPTYLDWWQSLKASSEDEASCLTSIIVKQGKPINDSPSNLQAELDYAVNTYGSACLALPKLSNNPNSY